MEIEVLPALSCPCTITLRPRETFSVGGGGRGGFAEHVLSIMRPGSFYTMFFDPITKTLTISLSDPTPES